MQDPVQVISANILKALQDVVRNGCRIFHWEKEELVIDRQTAKTLLFIYERSNPSLIDDFKHKGSFAIRQLLKQSNLIG